MTSETTPSQQGESYLDRIRAMRRVRNARERLVEGILFLAAFFAAA